MLLESFQDWLASSLVHEVATLRNWNLCGHFQYNQHPEIRGITIHNVRPIKHGNYTYWAPVSPKSNIIWDAHVDSNVLLSIVCDITSMFQRGLKIKEPGLKKKRQNGRTHCVVWRYHRRSLITITVKLSMCLCTINSVFKICFNIWYNNHRYFLTLLTIVK